MKVFIFAALLAALAPLPVWAADNPPGQVYDAAPFNQNPQHFTSVRCVGQKFDCAHPPSDKDLIGIANTCATQSFSYPGTLLGVFSHKSPYENCALPTSVVPANASASGKIQWPICCIVPKGDKCTFECHSYFVN